ncbi:MAG: hypothetical protein HY788_06640 [Deltaproteobacteria bacterium]|nr:hypothetical protein [Deltaproteobacteria bacterium]
MRKLYTPMALVLMIILAVTMLSPTNALSDTENKPKLAIFPGRLPGVSANYTHVIMEAVFDVLDETGVFDPVYSSYPGDGRSDPKPIPANVLSADFQEKTWRKEGFFSGYEPDAKAILNKGKELGVNAVLLYSIDILGGGYDRMAVYLFDVDKGNVYYRRITDEIKHNVTGEISEETLRAKLRELNYTVFYKF